MSGYKSDGPISAVLGDSLTPSPAVSQVLSQVNRGVQQYCPTSFALMSGTTQTRVEDFTDIGLDAWRGAINALSQEVSSLYTNSHALKPIDFPILEEIGRFLKEQDFLYNGLRAPERQMAFTYRVIAFSLLPHYLRESLLGLPLEKEELDVLRGKISESERLLKAGIERLKNGDAYHTIADQRIAHRIAQGLSSWANLPPEGEALINLLNQLTKVEVKKQLKVGISASNYVQDVLGVSDSLQKIAEDLLDQVSTEVDKVETIYGRNLSKSAGPNSKAYLEVKEVIRDTFFLIFEAAKAVLEDLSSSPPWFTPVPNLVEPFVSDALYLPYFCEGASIHGILLLHPSYMAREHPLLQANIAFVLAHEIIPGHREHISRGHETPYAELFNITRSPTGAEGWAAYAESILELVSSAIPDAPKILYFHRLRRLVAVLSAIASEQVKKELSNLSRDLRSEILRAADRSRASFHQILAYVWGARETERVFGSLSQFLAHLPRAKMNELYVALGPLSPRSVEKALKSILAKGDISNSA